MSDMVIFGQRGSVVSNAAGFFRWFVERTMPEITPTLGEFELLENGVRHKPTGYVYLAGQSLTGENRLHLLTRTLPDGRKYNADLVQEMCFGLWEMRKPK